MCSQSFAPTSNGPGMADLPCVAVAPISLAYSGFMAAVTPDPRVARCHALRKATKIATERTAARNVSEAGMLTDLFDFEACQIIFRLRGIEGFAHDDECLGCALRRRQIALLHQLRGIGCQIHLAGDARIVDITLDLTPALHLRHDPHRERLPR